MVSSTVNVRVGCSFPHRAVNNHDYRLSGIPHFSRESSMESFIVERYKMPMTQTRHIMPSTSGKC